MSIWFYVAIGILITIIIVLLFKLIGLRLSIREIRTTLTEILKSDTNNLITVSSGDKEVKKLCNSLNTELKSLRNQRLQYENGNQEIKTLATNISHDLRTPLTAISGYVDLMKESKDSTKQEEYLQIVENKTEDLILRTEQLFDFFKTLDIGVNIEKEEICINELLEEALANFYTIFKEKAVIPQVEITEQKIYKNVDKNTIFRVFENILSNVSKYSNGDFKVRLEDSGKVTFSNKASFLDRASVEKIFNRYYTVENAKKSTGVGLSIAKQLVELNGGRIVAKYEAENLIIEIEL